VKHRTHTHSHTVTQWGAARRGRRGARQLCSRLFARRLFLLLLLLPTRAPATTATTATAPCACCCLRAALLLPLLLLLRDSRAAVPPRGDHGGAALLHVVVARQAVLDVARELLALLRTAYQALRERRPLTHSLTHLCADVCVRSLLLARPRVHEGARVGHGV
jgi:hypothetical protein